ncbi:sugar phosphate isomerase/epimerase family protein [Pseudoclavibacter helvolus]
MPIRYHDYKTFIKDATPDFLEFHFSYKDLEIDPDSVFTEPLDMDFTTHLPDLYSGDFIVDLASFDDEHWERSIREVQRTIDTTRSLKKWFLKSTEPIIVVTMGGITTDKHVEPHERRAMYDRIEAALARLDAEGVQIGAQTLPPFPWFMGGQQFCNLFVDPRDTAEFCERTGTKLTFDVSHSKLAANFVGVPFSELTDLLAPHSIHLHLVDAKGVDGEGVQVGEGEIDWPLLAGQLNEYTPNAPFIPEIWQGHINNGQGFWTALDRLEKWL